MGSIWKPTVHREPYRGNIQSHCDFWTPTQTPDLYHYGRKGMKWYQHIFGNFNLKAMGTGVGNLLDEEKIKEIARKLGIPLNQINQKMGIIREYFMKERQQQIGNSNPPAYEKTRRDAEELRKTVEAVNKYTRSIKEREREIGYDNGRPIGEKTHEEVQAEKKAKRDREIEAIERKTADERHHEYLKEQREKREYRKKQQEYDEWLKKAQKDKKTAEQRKYEEDVKNYKEFVKRMDAAKKREEEERKREERRQKFVEEQLEEQRREEEKAYEEYKKRMTPTSGGGHKF